MKGLVLVTMLAAATETAAPPPMPSVAVPSPITVVQVPPAPPRISQRGEELPLATFDIVVTAGREPLWSGAMRVGASGANYNQTLREADEPCPSKGEMADTGSRYGEDTRQISVSISRRSGRDGPERFSINARWARPLAACEGWGNRGVTLDQTADIAPGQTVRIKGDAGLEIVLTRRAR